MAFDSAYCGPKGIYLLYPVIGAALGVWKGEAISPVVQARAALWAGFTWWCAHGPACGDELADTAAEISLSATTKMFGTELASGALEHHFAQMKKYGCGKRPNARAGARLAR